MDVQYVFILLFLCFIDLLRFVVFILNLSVFINVHIVFYHLKCFKCLREVILHRQRLLCLLFVYFVNNFIKVWSSSLYKV